MKMNNLEQPLLISSVSKGGFRTIPFILGTEAFEKLATNGIVPNMIVYLMEEYHMGMKSGSNLLYLWSFGSNFMPFLGAIAADSLVGRYTMITFGSIVTLLGMIVLSLTTLIPQTRPPECTSAPNINNNNNVCNPATFLQLLMLCTSFGLLSIGGGAIRCSCLVFGADQLEKVVQEEENGGNSRMLLLGNYINWHSALCTFSILLASSFIVYIQENLGWKIGFGIPVMFMFISTLLFFIGSPFYIKLKSESDVMLRLVQVITASFKKRHVKLSSSSQQQEEEQVHHGHDDDDDDDDHHHQYVYHHMNGSSFILPSDNLRFLNRACVVMDADQELTMEGKAKDPWSLCTVDQVEDFKSLIRVIPLWSTGMIMAINTCQNSFPVLQAFSMNRDITIAGGARFRVPAGSFSTFSNMFIVLFVILYHQALIPITSRIAGKHVQFSTRQRMGTGILISFLSMIVAGVIENRRRNRAALLIKMSAMWLIPQYSLIGLSQGLNFIAQSEFYYLELPKNMSSISSTLCALGNSMANLVASLLMSSFGSLSRRNGKKESWISSNIDKGHYDYYYWFLASISLINFVYFVICSNVYGPCKGEMKFVKRIG